MDNTNVPFAVEVYYRNVMLKLGEFSLAYDKHGQTQPLPKKNSDTVKFRRYERLAKASSPLTPGVSPTGSNPEVTDIEATVRQYGDFVRFYDTVEELNPDPVLMNLTRILRLQWAETINEIARDNVTAGDNVQYADASDPRTNTLRTQVNSADKISLNEVQIAVKTLQKLGAMKHTNYVNPVKEYGTVSLRPCYIGIVDPDTLKDLKNLGGFITPDKYAAQTTLMDNEVGALDEVRFVLDTEGKTYTAGGASSIDVHATIIFGAEAYGTVEVGEMSTDLIYQPLGSAGSADPLKQRGTLGWKQWYTAVILNEDFIVRIEHAVSA